jgi:ATP-dependent RNA helicase RhlE
MTFADLGLVPELLRALAEKGYDTPTPIQSQAIPAVLGGRDVLAGAQTGTGKTAAFVLPILQKLGAPTPGRATPRALVLTPTRELAAQVAESARTYGRYVGLRTQVVFGGVSINPQIDGLRNGCDVLIATPGRLIDLSEQRAVDLRNVQYFVLDEGDRMLDMGFIDDIRRILALLPAKRQNLLFSATLDAEVRSLASTFLDRPESVDVAPTISAAESVEQVAYLVDADRKRDLLAHLVLTRDLRQVLVFTRTKQMTRRLASQLDRDGVEATAIHGDRTQPERERALEAFKGGEVRVLVATDVAARGLDIEALPVVVNFEIPYDPEDYVHRIGRTGRAGMDGIAISLVSFDEEEQLKGINRLLKRDLPLRQVRGFEVDPASRSVRSSSRAGRGRTPVRGRGGPSGGRRSPGRRSGSPSGSR